MKKLHLSLFVGIFAMVFSFQVQAQDAPAPSPLGKVHQRVGLTDIELTYSRPGVKDRTIFAADGLVPYGEVWRTGANARTTISFSTDVMVDGNKVPTGDYSIFTIPGKEEWTVIFNKVTDKGVGSYDKANDALRVTVEAQEYPVTVETLTMGFGNITDTSTDMYLIWEDTMIMVPITVEKTW